MGLDREPVGLETEPMGLGIKPIGVSPSQALFQAEHLGLLFPASRVKRIRLAQDALSHVEEKVYDLLWGVKNQSRDPYRIAEYSLQRIAHDGRLNIKTVRELLPRLVDKGFISVEREADVRRNKPTQYRVLSYSEVLADQRQRKRFWVVKTGKGVFYAHPVSVGVSITEEALAPEPMGLDSGPGGFGSTPSGFDESSEVHGDPVGFESKPMGHDSKPVGLDTKPMGLGSKPGGLGLSPEGLGALSKLVREGLNVPPDEGLLRAMVLECRDRAEKATGTPAAEEEILHFAAAKIRVLRHSSNLRNPLAVLKKAVCECFSGQPFVEYRQAESARKQRELQEAMEFEELLLAQEAEEREFQARQEFWDRVSLRHKTERGYDLKAIAEDSELDEKGREVATERMKRLGRYVPNGL